MTPAPGEIISKALSVHTMQEARHLQDLIAEAIGARYERPLGDRWNNIGLMGSAGSFDLKLIELVTNMQDSVVEKLALCKWGRKADVPYRTPRDAATDLLGKASTADQSRMVTVRFEECTESRNVNELARHTKRLTAIFRDQGCGLSPSSIPDTIFALGGSHKEDALFLQGAFGLGGALTYRNADAVVLVSRRDPKLLQPGEIDNITVAVVTWRVNTKGQTALYLVSDRWSKPGDAAIPWHAEASAYPEFEPGTHIALIGYRVDGFHRRREGDEKSFDVVANTRLFEPIMPIRFTNATARENRATTLRGLQIRLENAEHQFSAGDETLPFTYKGTTYLLPVSYTLFEKPRTAGGRDKYVAHDHTVMFTSNGQVHHHWSPSEFRNKTSLNRLYDRVLVVVETDALPIQLRTSLFTADRNSLLRGDAALRLEEDVAGFISGWDALRDENNALLREALRATADEGTAEIAKRISRALSVPGFSPAGGSGAGGGKGSGSGGGGGGGGGGVRSIALHADPTHIEGPKSVQAVIGHTRSISYIVDVLDSFYDGRGQLTVSSDHPEIRSSQEITVGRGRGGRVRVMVAVPDTVEPGTFNLYASLDGWHKMSGGLGPRLDFITTLELVEEIPGKGAGTGKPSPAGAGQNGPAEGSNVAVRWSQHEDRPDWVKLTVGSVEKVPAHVLASVGGDYAALASLGDLEIPTLTLNQDYPPFKKYLESRNRTLTNVERPREAYATGVGIALLLLNQAIEETRKEEVDVPEEFIANAQRAAAKGVLAIMPSFDELAREAGLDPA